MQQAGHGQATDLQWAACTGGSQQPWLPDEKGNAHFSLPGAMCLHGQVRDLAEQAVMQQHLRQ